MSYRLVDSNNLALKYPEVNDMPCIYADLPNGLDDGHYVLEPSRKGHCETCCDGVQTDKARLCQKSYLAGMEHAKHQPSRKGHWIDYRDDGFVECPFCEHATNCEDNIDELHYCFYCGAELSADMRGDIE